MATPEATDSPDSAELEQVLAIVEGHPLVRIDQLYGDVFSIHIGDLIAGRRGERGSWVVTEWGADICGSSPSGDFDSREEQAHETLEKLRSLVGIPVKRVKVEPKTLSCHITLEKQWRVSLLTDTSYDGDAWAIGLPSMETVTIHVDARWSRVADK